MSSTANYAATPIIDAGSTTTADTSYSAPDNATVGVLVTAPSGGARIDNIDAICQGTSVAGLARLWACDGTPGVTISSITSSGTTATVTTAVVHGLVTGDLISLWGAFPIEYNVKSVAVTVLSTTTFTYTIVTTGSVAAQTVGAFSSTRAAAVYKLLAELPVIAVVGSATNRAFGFSLDSQSNSDFMPIHLPPGYSLRMTVTTTQTNALRAVARGGSF